MASGDTSSAADHWVLGLMSTTNRERWRARTELNRELAEAQAYSRRRWPGLAPDERTLWAEVAKRMENADELPTADAFAEIYLATACAEGTPAALAAFETSYLDPLAAVLGRFQMSASALDELKQTLRARLLVGKPPRVLQYAGRGGLNRVVTVAAVRLAVDGTRGQPLATLDEETHAVAANCNPELEYMQRAYTATFKQAFERAVAALNPHERGLLRLHIVDKLSIDDICVIYNVHRASAARRIEAARQAVARHARRHLRSAGIEREQLDAAFALVQSQLDLSMSRILRAGGADDPNP